MRVIAATNRNLQEEVAERRFREDLYYRLNVFPLHLPPLRDRSDSIPLLADYFLSRFSHQFGKKLKGIDDRALQAMKSYSWPGNVRELQNVIERAVILAAEFITLDHLPGEMLQKPDRGHQQSRDILRSTEREIIAKALHKHGGNRRLAAEELGISRRSLQYKLKEYGLLEAT